MRERTVPDPESLEKIKGYNTLTIYKMAASPYWYVRYYEDGKIFRKSTRKEDKREARAYAKAYFGRLKSAAMNALPLKPGSGFEACARGLLKDNEARAARGEISASKMQFDEARLERDLMPWFGKMEMAQVNYKAINDYINHITKRGLGVSSLKIHLSHIKTICRYSQRMGVIQYMPAFPPLKTVDKPRGWFSSWEYNKLHNTARANIGKTFKLTGVRGESQRIITLTDELYDLILFMTNTFIRPTDIRVLRHKHVAIVKQGDGYLRLTHPATKGHASPVISMPLAVAVYERLRKRAKTEGHGAAEDFLFQPQYENRDYAMRQLHRQFDQLLAITDLKTSAAGEPRSLYSLRHSAIMFRLIKSDGLNPITLARSARTSVEMIDRFYARHLTAEMDVDALQSLRPRKKGKHDKAAATDDASLYDDDERDDLSGEEEDGED
jgi:hypothetical protein